MHFGKMYHFTDCGSLLLDMQGNLVKMHPAFLTPTEPVAEGFCSLTLPSSVTRGVSALLQLGSPSQLPAPHLPF